MCEFSQFLLLNCQACSVATKNTPDPPEAISFVSLETDWSGWALTWSLVSWSQWTAWSWLSAEAPSEQHSFCGSSRAATGPVGS